MSNIGKSILNRIYSLFKDPTDFTVEEFYWRLIYTLLKCINSIDIKIDYYYINFKHNCIVTDNKYVLVHIIYSSGFNKQIQIIVYDYIKDEINTYPKINVGTLSASYFYSNDLKIAIENKLQCYKLQKKENEMAIVAPTGIKNKYQKIQQPKPFDDLYYSDILTNSFKFCILLILILIISGLSYEIFGWR